MHWAELVRQAERHLAWCEAVATSYPKLLEPPWASPDRPRPRVVLAIGTDLGLCGPLNRRVAERCTEAGLREPPTVLAIVVGARLAQLEPLPEAVQLPAPTSFAATERRAAAIEDLIAQLPEPLALDLHIVLAGAVGNDAQPEIEIRRGTRPDLELNEDDQAWLTRVSRLELDEVAAAARQARSLARHARILAALARAVSAENEARWRTMSRAYESAQRRIAEQERKLRRLRQELITQEMLEARQGAR
jgi:F0F1-type ATP synthase gamma subunit